MIVIINGPYGVGKSTVAMLVKGKLSGSVIYDPEKLGFILQKTLFFKRDYQHSLLWRKTNVLLPRMMNVVFRRPIIIPMTFPFLKYFETFLKAIKQSDLTVHHFCLMATKSTLTRRLAERPHNEWAMNQIDRCLSVFQSSIYEEKIKTDYLAPLQLSELILDKINHRNGSKNFVA